jgi:hypothetical protein
LTRRGLLGLAGVAALQAAAGAWPSLARAFGTLRGEERGESERFHFAQVRYRGGDWDPNPTSAVSWTGELVRRTSVAASTVRREILVMSPELFSYPMVYLTGDQEFDPFSREEIQRLRAYLDYGGFLVADDAAGQPGFNFDRAFRREMGRIYPEKPLTRIPRDHSIFKAYYLVRTVAGRKVTSPYLEGVELGNRTAVVYCQNDLGGALARDATGGWIHPCQPGGDRQRVQSFQLAVNVVMYALCQDYKSDIIHIPFLRQRI